MELYPAAPVWARAFAVVSIAFPSSIAAWLAWQAIAHDRLTMLPAVILIPFVMAAPVTVFSIAQAVQPRVEWTGHELHVLGPAFPEPIVVSLDAVERIHWRPLLTGGPTIVRLHLAHTQPRHARVLTLVLDVATAAAFEAQRRGSP